MLLTTKHYRLYGVPLANLSLPQSASKGALLRLELYNQIMLQNIRDGVQGTLAKVIVAIIAIPFAAFGIDAFFTGGVPEVAIVNGEEITEPQLLQSIEMRRRLLIGQMGEDFDASLLEDAALRQPVLESLIDRTLMKQLADDQGLAVSESMINSIILADESFHEEGKFSQQRYENLLRSSGFSPGFYKSTLAEDVLLGQLSNGLAQSEFVSERELEIVTAIAEQQRDIRYLIVDADSLKDDLKVEADEIREYYESNSALFFENESIDIEYLEITRQDLDIDVDDEAVEEEYQRQSAAFSGEAERHAAHILIEIDESRDDESARAELQQLAERINSGEDFADLAREHSMDLGSKSFGGDVGFSAGDAFPDEFEDALAELAVGEISAPVKTDAGWHLIKLIEETTAEMAPLAELRDEIVRQLSEQEVKLRMVELSESLGDLTYNADDLSDAAREYNLSVQTLKSLSRESAEGTFAEKAVLDAAFSDDLVVEGHNSDVIELSPEHLMVLRVSAHYPRRQKDLDEVAADVEIAVRVDKQRRLLIEQGDDLLAELKTGVSVETLATVNQLEWQVALSVKRTSFDVNEVLLSKVFEISRPSSGSSSYGSVLLDEQRLAVVEVSKVVDGSLDSLTIEQRAQIMTAFRQVRVGELANSFRLQLRENAEIELL